MTRRNCDFLGYVVHVNWTPRAIKSARGARGWNQQRLADELDVDRNTVSNWERGVGHPGAANLAALDRVLGEHQTKGPTLREASMVDLARELLARVEGLSGDTSRPETLRSQPSHEHQGYPHHHFDDEPPELEDYPERTSTDRQTDAG